MDLGPHAVFIWLCYGAVGLVVGAMIGWLWLDGRRHARELARLEDAEAARTSAGGRQGAA